MRLEPNSPRPSLNRHPRPGILLRQRVSLHLLLHYRLGVRADAVDLPVPELDVLDGVPVVSGEHLRALRL